MGANPPREFQPGDVLLPWPIQNPVPHLQCSSASRASDHRLARTLAALPSAHQIPFTWFLSIIHQLKWCLLGPNSGRILAWYQRVQYGNAKRSLDSPCVRQPAANTLSTGNTQILGYIGTQGGARLFRCLASRKSWPTPPAPGEKLFVLRETLNLEIRHEARKA